MAFVFSFLFLSLTAQVLLTHAAPTFTFSTIRQCEPFSVSFTGMPGEEAQPASLSLIPLSSVPVIIPMTAIESATSSIYLTSIPFRAGTQFVASLEDAAGTSVARISDLITVLPSQQAGNNFCLPEAPAAPRKFQLSSIPSQCEEFTVMYNATSVTQAPQVKAFNPEGIALVLNNTYDDPDSGIARYIMGMSSGKQVALLIDGSSGFRETTSLITVSGNVSSPSDCLFAERESEAHLHYSTVISSKAVIIGASSGGAIVFLVLLAMAFFIVRDKKRKRERRRLQALSFEPPRMFGYDLQEKIVGFPRSTFDSAPRIQTGSVVDPTYTKLGSPEDPPDRVTSWGNKQEWTTRSHPKHTSRPSLALSETRNIVPHPSYDADHLSLNSLDIEGMLNMAATQAEIPSRKSSIPMVFDEDPQQRPKSPETFLKHNMQDLAVPRRALKVSSDIPEGALSATPSLFSFTANPFVPEEEIIKRASRRYPSSPSLFRTPGGSIGLPASPRSVMLLPGRASIAGSGLRSPVSEWYGVGIAR